MPTYTLCSNFVCSANSPCRYFTDGLLVFTQTNSFKVAVDSEGNVLDAYHEIAAGDNEFVRMWLDLLASNPDGTMDKIVLPINQFTTQQELFIAVCNNTFGVKKLICHSKQDYLDHQSDIEHSNIQILDRDEALIELNRNQGINNIFAKNSTVAMGQSQIIEHHTEES